ALVGRITAGGPNVPYAGHGRALVTLHLNGHAPGQSRNVKEFRFGAVRTRPIVVAPRDGWADLLEGGIRREITDIGVGLDIFHRIVIDRVTSLLIYTLRPIDVIHVWLRADDLAVMAIHRVKKTIAR